MSKNRELTTLTADNLTHVQGGSNRPWGNDAAHQAATSFRSSFHAWRTRTGQAFTDAATRNPRGAVSNSVAATYDLNAAPLKAFGGWAASFFK